MAEQPPASTVRIFVSSPGDVLAERERVDRIAQRLNAAFQGAVHIETVRWERSYYTADSTFQRQIVDPGACDLVVSIFWQRLGSELPRDFEVMRDGRPYPSGTVYELVKALQANAQRGLPHVFVYRKMADAAVPMGDRDRYRQAHEQREAFLMFWEEWFVSEEGHFKAAYNTFNTPDDFEAKFEEHLRTWLKSQGYASGSTSWSLAEKGSPFCSLEPFGAGHEEVFFGRGRDIDRAIERLSSVEESRRQFLLILGESGSGKSSLARAGIVPRILRGALGGEASAWRAATLKPGAAADPLTALAEALCAPGALPEIMAGDFKSPAMLCALFRANVGTAPIVNALDRVAVGLQDALGSETPPRGGLVILADQLEELFLPSITDDVRELFAQVLYELLGTGRIVILGTLRSDAYAEFTRSPGLLALKDAGSTLDVTTPGAAEIAEIVRSPAAAAGLRYGPAEGSEHLDDVIIQAASGGDALPLLQFTLSRLFEAMRDRLAKSGRTFATADAEDLTLTYPDYLTFGGLEGAIGERAEEAFGTLDEEAQARLPRLLRALAAIDAGEGPAQGLHLFQVAIDKVTGDAPATALVDALIATRVMVTQEAANGHRYLRLAHEAVLRTWKRARNIVAEHADFFRIRADLIAGERRYSRQRTEHGGRSANAFLLARGVPLAEAESIRNSFADELSPAVTEFIDRSVRQARLRQRLLAAVTVVFAVTAIAASASAFFAVRSEQRAAQNFNIAVAQADALITRISEELKDLAISRDALRRLLNTIERQFDQIAKVNPDHPRLLLSRAHMLTAFVDNYLDLGETGEALQRAEQCVAIARRLVKLSPDEPQITAALGACLDRTGNVYRDRGLYDNAITAYQEAVTHRRALVAADQANRAWRRDLADALRSLGYALVSAGKNESSLAALDESVALAHQVASESPDDAAMQRVLIDSLNTHAIVLSQLKRPQESLARYRESAEVARRLVDQDAGNTTWRRYLSNILYNSHIELIALGQEQEALETLQQSLALRRGLIALDPGNMLWQRELSYILVDIGTLYAKTKNNEAALTAFREAVAIVRRLIEVDTGNITWKNELRKRLPPVVELLVGLGKRDDAIALVKDAIALLRDSVAANPNDKRQKFELGWLLSYYATVLTERGELDQSTAANEEALALMRVYLAENPQNEEALQNIAVTLSNYGRDLQRRGKIAEAQVAAAESVAHWRRLIALTPQNVAFTIELADALRDLAPLSQDPKTHLREALALLRDLERRGLLPEAQRSWISEIENSLSG